MLYMKPVSLIKGPIWKGILSFSWPLLISSFIQQLYNTVDIIFVGNVLGKEATAAVGASSLFVTCLVGLFSGVSVGASVLSGFSYGKSNPLQLQNVVKSGMFLGFLSGFVMMIIGLVFAPFFLKIIKTPFSIIDLAVTYSRIYFLSLIPMATYTMGSALLRSMGNSKGPMVIHLIGGLTNVFMNALFLIVLKAGVAGVAVATLISQMLTAALVIQLLWKQITGQLGRSWKTWFDLDLLKNILVMGLPIGLQAVVITLSNVFVQYSVNGLGVDAVAAFTAYFKVELLIYLPILALSQGMITFTSQNIGAAEFNRAKKGTFVVLIMGVSLVGVISIFVLTFAPILLGLISRDPVVIELGRTILRTTVPFYWLYLVWEVFAGTIRGSGKTFPPMMIIVMTISLLRIIMLILITQNSYSIATIARVYPITWAACALVMILYYARGRWSLVIERRI